MSATIVHNLPLVELYNDFLTIDECNTFLQLPLNFQRSEAIWHLNGARVNHHSGRTSETAYGREFPEVHQLMKKIASFFNVPPNTIEPLHFTRYHKDQEYQAHLDFFKDGVNAINNRIYTLIIYLNENFQGGETDFPLLNKTVYPKTGSALFFKYNYEDTELNHLTLHAGCPVIDGCKNIITAWFRRNQIV